MKYLLDSHTLIWSIISVSELSSDCRKIIENSNNEVLASHVSFWEISMKYALGKIDLNRIKPEQIPTLCRQMKIGILSLSEEVVSTSYMLPYEIHRDPFDRMLAWQAIKHDLILLSKDKALHAFKRHGLKIAW